MIQSCTIEKWKVILLHGKVLFTYTQQVVTSNDFYATNFVVFLTKRLGKFWFSSVNLTEFLD